MKKNLFVVALASLFLFSSCQQDVKEVEKIVEVEKKENNNSSSTDNQGINVDNNDTNPPSNITNLKAANKNGAVLLWWSDATEEDIFGYEVSYTKGSQERAAVFTPLAKNTLIVAPGDESCLLRGLQYNTEYIFTVKSLDTSGNKSSGTSVTAIPYKSNIKITTTLPNDDGENIVLTKDSAPIKITISSENQIAKVVCKSNGEKRTGIKPENVIMDSNSKEIELDENNTAIITMTESGWFDFVVQDAKGSFEWEQVEIKTIDKTPLDEISDLKYTVDDENVYLSWKNPASKDKYDSPLKNIILSYEWDDNKAESNNGNITLDPDTETYTISVPASKKDKAVLQITTQTVDNCDNVSKGYLFTASWSNVIETTPEEAPEIIKKLAKQSCVEVKGAASDETVLEIAKALKTNPSVKVDLDLSELTNVEYLDSEVFAFSTKLVSVTLPKQLKSIGASAFENCTALQNINLNDELLYIQNKAFAGCINITNIVIPNSVINIYESAFSECVKLESFTISANTSIKYNTFYQCNNIEEIYFIGTLEQWCKKSWTPGLPAYTLYINNIEIVDITLPDTCISSGNFGGCISLKRIELSDSIINIDEGAFHGCVNLSNVVFSKNLVNIGKNAFNGCTSLTDITIPGGVISIGDSAFYGCTKLKKLTIPESVERIGAEAFNCCTKLSSIKLPQSISKVEMFTFAHCNNLTEINIPSNVTSIDASAFYATGITSITLPKGIKSIGNNAFGYCNNLQRIELPNTITFIGDYAFSGCTKVNIIYFDGTLEQWCDTNFDFCPDDCLYDLYINNQLVTGVQIPNSISYIRKNLFRGCKSITSIVLQNSIASIGENAFRNCRNLGNIVIPESVTSIDAYAFLNCEKLENIVFEDTTSKWYRSSYDSHSNSELIGAMSSTNTNENAIKVIKENDEYYFGFLYNELYNGD